MQQIRGVIVELWIEIIEIENGAKSKIVARIEEKQRVTRQE